MSWENWTENWSRDDGLFISWCGDWVAVGFGSDWYEDGFGDGLNTWWWGDRDVEGPGGDWYVDGFDDGLNTWWCGDWDVENWGTAGCCSSRNMYEILNCEYHSLTYYACYDF